MARRRGDLKAGLVLGVESVPAGLAAGLLAGLNPLQGLYGYLFGTLAGSLATSSAFMTVQATGAMAVIVADVPLTQGGTRATDAVVTLTVLTGLAMLAAWLLRLGWMLRFVPHAVVTGFVAAVAVNIVLGQLSHATGYTSDASNRVTRALDTALHPGHLDLHSTAVAAATIALILVFERTRLGTLGMVVALVLTSAVAAVAGWDTVRTVSDLTDIPRTLPVPALPSLDLVLPLVVPALSLAFVGLVQGAVVAATVPNPDGSYPDASGDFRGQGVANLAAGLLHGMPVGGSMSQTALVRAAGARSRYANLTAALVMALSVLLLGPVIGAVAMPALAGLLLLLGARMVKPRSIAVVWRTGPAQATVLVASFVLTVLIPLQYGVLLGVALSVVLHVVRQSGEVRLRRWQLREGHRPVEVDPPTMLPPGEVVVLVPYGSLFFASASVVEAKLPEVTPDSSGSVVVLRLRGVTELGSTFLHVVSRYANALRGVGSRLLLVGVEAHLHDQLARTRTLDVLGPENVYLATAEVRASLEKAVADAETWISENRKAP